MSEYNDLVEALRYLVFERLQNKGQFVHGLLGDGKGRVSVPGRPDFSYARPGRQTTAVFEVFNKEVAGPDGWPVLIGELPWQPGLTQVVGTDWSAYTDAGWAMSTSLVGPHARQHEFRDGAPGTDPVNVYRRALVEMKTVAVGSGSFGVNVLPYDYDYGVPKSWPGAPGLDLAAAMPATGTARLMLTYLDPVSNSIGLVTGTVGIHSDAVELPRPALPTGTWFPSAYVRLYGGQSSILERDIRDARRLFAGGISTGTASGGAPTGPAGGDLTGTYPNPTVAGLYGRSLLGTAPATGDVLMWTGSAWRPASSAGLGWRMGNTIVVSSSGAGNYDNLADAIAAAVGGDTIFVDVEGALACDNLELPDSVNLMGLGIGVTVLTANNATNTLTLGEESTLQNITVNNNGSGHAVNIDTNSAYLRQVGAYSFQGNAFHITATDIYFFNCYGLSATTKCLNLDGSDLGIEVYGGSFTGIPDVYLGDDASTFMDVYEFPVFKNGSMTGSGYTHGWWFSAAGTRCMMGSHTVSIDMEEGAAPLAPATGRWRFYFKSDGLYYIDDAGVETGPLAASGGAPTGPAGGDLTGTYPNPTVHAAEWAALAERALLADLATLATTASAVDLNGVADSLILDADGDTGIDADTDDQINFKAGGADRMTLTAAGLALASGARLNEFSIDGTLAGNSDVAAPTEKAVKTYVDGRVVPLATHATSTSWDGDAKNGASGTIDLSAAFGLPAGIRGIFARMRAVDETVNVTFQLKATSAGNGSIIGSTVLTNQSAFASGFCPCDANGDCYFLQSDELDAVYVEITGYLL